MSRPKPKPMKKIFILLLITASLSAYGQFNSGSVYFTGMTNGHLGTRIYEESFYIPFEISVEGGYFIKNRIALGGEIHTHGELSFSGNSSYELLFGPTIRYYRTSVKDFQAYYFGHAFYGFWNGNNNQTGLKGGVGFNYFLTERIALEARIGYKYQRQWYTEPFSGFNYHFNTHDLLFEFGITVFFPSIKFFDRT